MVLVFIEGVDGKVKKAAFEAVTYGYKTAQALGTNCAALVFGDVEGISELGVYGASKVYQVKAESLNQFDSQTYSKTIAAAVEKLGAQVLVMNHNSTGKSLLGRLAVSLNAGSVSAVTSVANTEGGLFKVQKGVFSGKAIAEYQINSDKKVLSLLGNSVQPESVASACDVEALDINVAPSRIKVVSRNLQAGDRAPLPEAELVVSAGRGMKGPENWGIIEELADVLGATTACSRPVADTGWRPHHEHVGQTGVAIKPNLYIAAGISGAIQHLAGVNSSKVIVVINKDPEAPFFKAADYGVCADLFEVVPRLTEAIRKVKS